MRLTTVFEHLGPVQDKWAPGQMGPGQMGTRTSGSRTNGSGLGLAQGNNCPGPICPRILNNRAHQRVSFVIIHSKNIGCNFHGLLLLAVGILTTVQVR